MGIALRAYGLSLGVRVTDGVSRERLVGCLPYGSQIVEDSTVEQLLSLVVAPPPTGRIRRYHQLFQGGALVARHLELNEILELLATRLLDWVATNSLEGLFVHAGVVARSGQAILLPGRSGVGKSTLTAALVRAGASYYSDEFAVIDSQGLVHPFAQPLTLRRENGGSERQILPAPSPSDSLPVGLVATTQFEPAASLDLRSLSPGRLLLHLLDHTVAARSDAETAFDRLARIARSAAGFEGPRGGARDAALELLQLADRSLPR